jgi:hypothetical protein
MTDPDNWVDSPPYGGDGWADMDGYDRWEWARRSMSFFLGVGLARYICAHFLIYGPRDDESFTGSEDDDPKGSRSRWLHVRGWTRRSISSTSSLHCEREQSAQLQESLALSSKHERYVTVGRLFDLHDYTFESSSQHL